MHHTKIRYPMETGMGIVRTARARRDLPAQSAKLLTPTSTSGEPDLATLFLNHAGLIEDCSAACKAIFGYPMRELRGRHVSLLLPKLAGMELVHEGQINSHLRFLCRCALAFLARRRDGTGFACEVFFNHLNSDPQRVQILVRELGVAES